jgi:thiol-disulfide isomerase/thioredoxin
MHADRRHLLLAALGCATLPARAAIAPGTAAPDFTLRQLAGAPLRLRELRGQVVMLNFWASWCGPCREEMPLLGRLHEKYRGSGFALLGVNVDDDPKNAAGVVERLRTGFPVLLDTDKAVSRLYEVKAMPSTLLIDRDGVLRRLHRGYQGGVVESTYEPQVRELLRD